MVELSAAALAIPCVAISIGWVANTWLRVRHGYPLENSWGKAIYPKTDNEAQQRIALLTQEVSQLRAENGAAKDRLATLERIVTDSGFRLTQEIAALESAREGRPQ